MFLALLKLKRIYAMKSKTRKSGADLPPFERGQIWQMGDANLEIGLVGKRLVHYKHYKAQAKRPPTQLSGKSVLERFLQKQGAILLSAAAPLAPAAGGRELAGRKSNRRRAATAS